MAGEPFDLLVAAPGQIDGLIKEGKIISETRTDLTRSGIGVEVVDGEVGKLWILAQFGGVHPEASQPRPGQLPGQMRPVARHKVEKNAMLRQQLAVDAPRGVDGEVVDVDDKARIVTTPAYMLARRIGEAAQGIDKLCDAVVRMAR